MEIELSSEQSLLLAALDKLSARYRAAPTHDMAYVHYSQELRQELADGGFLGIAVQEGYGPLEATLLVEHVAKLPYSAEVAASALLSYALGREFDGPVAVCDGIGRPTRYLPQARHAFILTDEGVRYSEIADHQIRAIDSVIAYPLGALQAMPSQTTLLDRNTSCAIQVLWRVAIAAEAAGLMRSALNLTTTHVKDRHQFGRALGDFQGIQHRLAGDEQIVSAAFLLAMRAAYTLRAEDAAIAALYAQKHMRQIIYDCHQFTGAMGVTLEYPLHLWTYRLKFIQGEFGGYAAQAAALSEVVWPAKRTRDEAMKILRPKAG